MMWCQDIWVEVVVETDVVDEVLVVSEVGPVEIQQAVKVESDGETWIAVGGVEIGCCGAGGVEIGYCAVEIVDGSWEMFGDECCGAVVVDVVGGSCWEMIGGGQGVVLGVLRGLEVLLMRIHVGWWWLMGC